MEKSIAAPLVGNPKYTLPVSVLLRLNTVLRKTLFSRKFYQEINDKVLSKTSTLDSTLYFICYFTLTLSAILNNKPQIKKFIFTQKANLFQVLNKLSTKTIGLEIVEKKATKETLEKSGEKAVVKTEVEEKSNMAVHLKAISSYILDIRIFNRLTEAIKYMPWIIDEFTAMMNPALSVPRLDRIINFAQAINCLILELLENAGWLTDHNWVGTSDNTYWCIETYIWCSRVWGLYLIVEIVELIRRTPSSKWNKDWRINLFKQLVQVPLVLHWSLYEGCLTPFWVGLCGSGASWWEFKRIWLSIEL